MSTEGLPSWLNPLIMESAIVVQSDFNINEEDPETQHLYLLIVYEQL